MLSSSANTAFTNRIRNSMGQIPCHGMSAPPAVTVVICYPCCRYILLPILPVRTSLPIPPSGGIKGGSYDLVPIDDAKYEIAPKLVGRLHQLKLANWLRDCTN